MTTFETHGPCTVTLGGGAVPLSSGASGFTNSTSSKGVASATLYKNGSPLATARVALNSIAPLTKGIMWDFTSGGPEGDNGSTSSKIIYVLDDGIVASGGYTMELSLSGKFSGEWTESNDSDIAFCSGNGNATVNVTVGSGI